MFVTTTIKDTGERKQMSQSIPQVISLAIHNCNFARCLQPVQNQDGNGYVVIHAEFGVACTQTRRGHRPKNGAEKGGGCQDKIVPKTIGSAKSGYTPPLWEKMTSLM